VDKELKKLDKLINILIGEAVALTILTIIYFFVVVIK
jgi:hypothetical protein